MPPKYPPLSFSEVRSILEAHGFVHIGTKGSHYQYQRTRNGIVNRVTLAWHGSDFDAGILKLMIAESGLSYREFYCATKVTAKKINAQPIKIRGEA